MGIYFESLLVDATALLVILVTSAYLYFRYWFSYWQYRGIPYLQPEIPYGNIRKLVKSEENFGVHIAEKYTQLKKLGRPYGGIFMFTKPILVLIDPALCKTVLIKEFSKFPDRGIYSNEEADPLSGNMFALKGQKWKTIRNKLSPIFTSGKMKMMFQTLVAITEELERILEADAKNGPICVKDLLARFTTDVIGSCVFGLDCNSLKDPRAEFKKYGQQFIDRSLSNSVKIVAGLFAPRLMKAINMTVTDKESGDFFLNALRDTIEYREKNNVHRKDFVDLFIRLKHNENIQDEHLNVDAKFALNNSVDGITFNELAAQAFVFFIAGFETSSTTSAVCLLELAQNLDVQTKLRKEINDVMKQHGGLTYEALMEMKYLDKVVNETLRKYPIAPSIVRVCREECQVGDFLVEKGTTVWMSVLGYHMDPEYYPDPEKFDPERFNEENCANRVPFTYMPFGEGPRNCIGMRFALLQSKAALIALLKNYTYSLAPKTEVPTQWVTKGVLLFPKNEIPLVATRAL